MTKLNLQAFVDEVLAETVQRQAAELAALRAENEQLRKQVEEARETSWPQLYQQQLEENKGIRWQVMTAHKLIESLSLCIGHFYACGVNSGNACDCGYVEVKATAAAWLAKVAK